MSKPKNHHFVPKFYMRPWTVNSMLHVYSRPGSHLEHKPRSPKVTCSIDDLYKLLDEIKGVCIKNDIETKIFKPLDQSACIVRDKLLRGETVTDADRSIWSKFIVSLTERTPWNIDDRTQQLSTDKPLQAIVNKLPQNHIDLQAIIRNAVIADIIDRTEDAHLVKSIAKMKWVLLHSETADWHLITSDNPLVQTFGTLSEDTDTLSIALSPSTILIMTDNTFSCDENVLKLIAASYNIHVIKQARRFVISSCELQDTPCMKYSRIIELLRPFRST